MVATWTTTIERAKQARRQTIKIFVRHPPRHRSGRPIKTSNQHLIEPTIGSAIALYCILCKLELTDFMRNHLWIVALSGAGGFSSHSLARRRSLVISLSQKEDPPSKSNDRWSRIKGFFRKDEEEEEQQPPAKEGFWRGLLSSRQPEQQPADVEKPSQKFPFLNREPPQEVEQQQSKTGGIPFLNRSTDDRKQEKKEERQKEKELAIQRKRLEETDKRAQVEEAKRIKQKQEAVKREQAEATRRKKEEEKKKAEAAKRIGRDAKQKEQEAKQKKKDEKKSSNPLMSLQSLWSSNDEEWVDVFPKTRIMPGESVPVQVGGIDLLVVASTDARRIYCIANSCPHLGTPLETGVLARLPVEESTKPSNTPQPFTEERVTSLLQQDGCEDCIVCPLHKTAFALASGEVRGEWCPYPPVLGKIVGAVKQPVGAAVFDVRTRGKFVQVRLNSPLSK